MRRTLIRLLLAACLFALTGAQAAAAKPSPSLRCYRADDAVKCFVDAAKAALARVEGDNDRADALGETLYALAIMRGRDDALAKEAAALAASRAVRPVKQMDLLYALDLYADANAGEADRTYVAALRRFAALERELKGGELIDLYANACSIIAWDDALRERWLDFAQGVCTPAKLQAAKPAGVARQALALAMMPVAMTLGGNREGFALSADLALSWLRGAERLAAKSKNDADKDLVGFIGVLMHTMNSLCLDAFDEPDAADGEVAASLRALRRLEARVGIGSRSANPRRMVIDSLFDTGREDEAKKLLRQMLARVDADPAGRKLPFAEQAAILLQAARLEHLERQGRALTCAPEGSVEI